MKLLDILREIEAYKGEHLAPDKESGSPLYDVTLNGNYPKDFYSNNGLRYYGSGDKLDSEAYYKILSYHNFQNKKVEIYRAVPKSLSGVKINKGDWVTIVRGYAVDHGKANLKNDYKILKMMVSARDLFTDGDSFLEWGYDPQPENKEYTKMRRLEKFKKDYNRVKNGEKIIMINKYPNDPFFEKEESYLKNMEEYLRKNGINL